MDPVTVMNNSVPIDYGYYKEALLKNLTKIMGNPVEYHNPSVYKTTRFVTETTPYTINRSGTENMFAAHANNLVQKRNADGEVKVNPQSVNNNNNNTKATVAKFEVDTTFVKEENLNDKKNQNTKEIQKTRRALNKMKEDKIGDPVIMSKLQLTLDNAKQANKVINAEIKAHKKATRERFEAQLDKYRTKTKSTSSLSKRAAILAFAERAPECAVCKSIIDDPPCQKDSQYAKRPKCNKCASTWGSCTHRKSMANPNICEKCVNTVDQAITEEVSTLGELTKKSKEIWSKCTDCMFGSLADAQKCPAFNCPNFSERFVADAKLQLKQQRLDDMRKKCSDIVKDKKILEW